MSVDALVEELPPAGYAATAKGGPLVAVCGLCGGAGASTLTYLLAAASARGEEATSGRAPILACDAGTVTAGLSSYAGMASPRSLAETAVALQEGRLAQQPMFVRDPHGVRLIAAGPRLDPPVVAAAEAVARIVRDARGAHGLTVVDCGTLAEEPQRIAARLASHVLWVVPATAGGARRAERALAAASWADGRPQVVVARRDTTGRKAPLRALTALADARRAPLVLMPEVGDLAETELDAALAAGEVALEALAGALRR